MAPQAESVFLNDKLSLFRIKNVCSVKETERRMKRRFTGWKEMFANVVSDKGLIPSAHKELAKLNSEKTNNPPPEIGKRLEQMFYLKRHLDFFCLFLCFVCFLDSA